MRHEHCAEDVARKITRRSRLRSTCFDGRGEERKLGLFLLVLRNEPPFFGELPIEKKVSSRGVRCHQNEFFGNISVLISLRLRETRRPPDSAMADILF